jgi:lipopolysaccharide transport system ATP-binding protein
MSDIAIRVENFGKSYRLQHQIATRYKTMREELAAIPGKAWSAVRRGFQPDHSSDETFWALKDVSFEVKQGEVVGIIGRNGAGKSTLLKILSRITEPSHGRAEVYGRIGSLLEVGTGFHPELTGRENIFLNGAILGMTKAEIRSKFDEIIAFAEVEKFLDTPVKRYSSGMYVRLAFAVAAHLDPEIMVVDEVLAVGDAEFQRKCLGKMQDVAHKGRTILFVSHNMAAIQQMCSRAILLQEGSVVLDSIPSQAVQHYLTASTATDSKVDLSKKKRPYSSDQRVKLVALEINDGRPVIHGEPCNFKLYYRSEKALTDLHFGIGVCAIDGVRYMTYDTYLADVDFCSREGIVSCVTLRIPKIDFQPSIYVIDVGVRLGGTYGLDYIPSVGQFEVRPGENTPSHIGDAGPGMRTGGDWTNSYENETD